MQGLATSYPASDDDDAVDLSDNKTVSNSLGRYGAEIPQARVALSSFLLNDSSDFFRSEKVENLICPQEAGVIGNFVNLCSDKSVNNSQVGLSRNRNFGTGVVSQSTLGSSTFQEQMLTFDRFGYSLDVNGNVLGDRSKYSSMAGSTIFSLTKQQQHDLATDGQSRKRKFDSNDIPSILIHDDAPLAYEAPSILTESIVSVPDSQLSFIFHPTSEWPQPINYIGKSFLVPSSQISSDVSQESYIPTRCISHSMNPHNNNRIISLNPMNSRLLLSGCVNGASQLYHYNSSNNLELLTSYLTSSSTCIKSLQHSPNGRSFVSSSYLTPAKTALVSHVDIETGKVFDSNYLSTCINCIQFNSDNEMLAACDNYKILQFDLRTPQGLKEASLEYNYHNGPVTSIQIFDNNGKFVSFSQDRKVLVWEMNTPVPTQYISETYLSSVTCSSISYNREIMTGSSNSGIFTFQTTDRGLRPLRKKTFRGHATSGFACQAALAPNLRYLASGDGTGDLTFWDWKTKKVFRKLHAHDGGPCACCIWHPNGETIFTCGWDGVIKAWD